MQETAGPLLTTKLYIPPARPNLVPRPRLMQRLDEALRLRHRLTLVSARAGSGKTTLVSEWLHQQDRRAAWLSLDVNDNDPRRFWGYVIAALGQLGVRIGPAVLSQMEALQLPRKIKAPGQGFGAGKVAMVVGGPWLVDELARSESGFEVGVAPFPPPDGHPERANTSVVQGAVVVLPAGAKEIEPAVTLLAWMMSPEIMAEAMSARARLPARRSAALDLRFRQIPGWDVFGNLAAHPKAAHPAITSVSSELNAALSQVEREALHQGGDPVQLLDQVQSEFALKQEQVPGGLDVP